MTVDPSPVLLLLVCGPRLHYRGGAEEHILIRVLHLGLFPRMAPATWANDVPLETVANRSVPMACGPNVDQTGSPRGQMSLYQALEVEGGYTYSASTILAEIAKRPGNFLTWST
jgi:hypothetical protein